MRVRGICCWGIAVFCPGRSSRRGGGSRMSSMVLLLAALGGAGLWFWATRVTQRSRWWFELNLPGEWRCEVDSREHTLRFTGSPEEGSWSCLEPDGVRHQGEWSAQGSEVLLRGLDGADVLLQVRRFEDGTLGLHGGPWVYRVYTRTAENNVVPLRGRGRKWS